MTRPTVEERKAMRERWEKTTQGEWRYDGQHDEIVCWTADDPWLLASECRLAPDNRYACDQFGHQFRPDFAFMAAAHQDLPAVLDALDEAEQEIENIRYAAHMPDDYEYGLPSWINQQLYGKLLEMTDKDGGPIRRSEDLELMWAQRREIARLKVLVADYQGQILGRYSGGLVQAAGQGKEL